MKPSKRYRAAAAPVNGKKTVSLDEALRLLRAMPPAKFDETVELALRLGVDPSKSEQNVRGIIALPHGTGKSRRVIVFCRGELQSAAQAAGAEAVGAEELIQKVQGGWLAFDVAVAAPDMMREVSRLGKVLGPRGLMPNPKAGTVTEDVAKAVKELKAGRVEFKMDKQGNLHLVVGRRSFPDEALKANCLTICEAVMRTRPAGLKGSLIQTATLCGSMTPGVRVMVSSLIEGVN